MTLNREEIQFIIMLRGLGYKQHEIANKIGCSEGAVSHHLNKVKKEAKENGVNDTFWLYFSIESLAEAIFKPRDK